METMVAEPAKAPVVFLTWKNPDGTVSIGYGGTRCGEEPMVDFILTERLRYGNHPVGADGLQLWGFAKRCMTPEEAEWLAAGIAAKGWVLKAVGE